MNSTELRCDGAGTMEANSGGMPLEDAKEIFEYGHGITRCGSWENGRKVKVWKHFAGDSGSGKQMFLIRLAGKSWRRRVVVQEDGVSNASSQRL